MERTFVVIAHNNFDAARLVLKQRPEVDIVVVIYAPDNMPFGPLAHTLCSNEVALDVVAQANLPNTELIKHRSNDQTDYVFYTNGSDGEEVLRVLLNTTPPNGSWQYEDLRNTTPTSGVY